MYEPRLHESHNETINAGIASARTNAGVAVLVSLWDSSLHAHNTPLRKESHNETTNAVVASPRTNAGDRLRLLVSLWDSSLRALYIARRSLLLLALVLLLAIMPLMLDMVLLVGEIMITMVLA